MRITHLDRRSRVGRWFTEFWGKNGNPDIVDELAAPDVLLHYSLHAPRCDPYVVGRWEGGGTHTGPAFGDFLAGSLPAATGRRMRFTGVTVLRLENGQIAEEIGMDDGVTALEQLGLIRTL